MQPADCPTNKITDAGSFNRLKATRHGMMLYNRNDIYIGGSLEHYGEYSEEEVTVFRQVLREGDTVIEVGSNIGAHTIPIAKMVGLSGSVMAIDPQRVVFQTLCANVALNSLMNVFAFPVAMGAADGSTLIPRLNYDRPNNYGGLALGKYDKGERVQIMTVDGLNVSKCSMLKIDAEGMELDVLRGARGTIERFTPVMYVENNDDQKGGELIRYIAALGYRMYWHLPYLYSDDNFFRNPNNLFPGIFSGNMLCFHAKHQVNLDDAFEPVLGPEDDRHQANERLAH